MKYIIRILMVLSVVLFFTGCEKDDNGRMPDNIKDSNAGVLKMRPSSDLFLDINNPNDFNLDLTVDVLFDVPFNKVEVAVVYNGDYSKLNVLSSITTVPADVSYSIQDIVDAVDGLNSVGDISEGDKFEVTTNIELSDGTFIPGFLSTGALTSAPGVRNVMDVLKGGSASLNVPVPCPFVPEIFDGQMEGIEAYNDGTSSSLPTVDMNINTELSTDNIVVYDIHDLWISPSLFRIQVDKRTYVVSQYLDPNVPADEQGIIYTGDYSGLGRIWFDDFTEPELSTCDNYIKFTVTPSLNDTGYWWGTTATYTIGPNVLAGKKSSDNQTPYYLRNVVKK